MLDTLQIKNFALIDSCSIDFSEGFTVLTGETGAGKSILIGALSFLLGGKASIDQIRAGTKEAIVSGSISLNKNCKDAFAWLEERAIDVEDSTILIRRVIKDSGKSASWIQNTPVTRAELAEFTSYLFDIHGQHEHQALMYAQNHRKYLDSYAGLEAEVEDFTKLYSALVEKRKILAELSTSDTEKKEKVMLLSFAIEEIEKSKLKPFEDEELAAEETKLLQYEQLYSDVDTSVAMVSSGEGTISSLLKKLNGNLCRASEIDKDLESLQSRIENAFYEISDIAEELKNYRNSLTFDPERLRVIQERNTELYKLKQKYASSVNAPISEVIEYGENAKIQLENLSSSEEKISLLKNEIKELETKVYGDAKKLSEKRKMAATTMSKAVVEVLSNLGMKATEFTVLVDLKPGDTEAQKCGPYGIDDVEFIFSANIGSPLKPLAKIASGGELSRVMLALKTVLCSVENENTTETLVFDEIDTGIGGEVAVSVGQHIKELSKNHQIFCITHLASIAAFADNQIKIEKSLKDSMTTTTVYELSPEERVTEIARMLSGDAFSEASLEHARLLLQKK